MVFSYEAINLDINPKSFKASFCSNYLIVAWPYLRISHRTFADLVAASPKTPVIQKTGSIWSFTLSYRYLQFLVHIPAQRDSFLATILYVGGYLMVT
ncbi:hypothetical protein J6590_085597 [Homalodisca vitripennis]|nr:hypothetical protein J6590_085597 [Homalodisca vitripennis]